jgi:hypothetical protein
MARVSANTEDIALQIIKSIFTTKDRVGVMDNTIEAFSSSNKRLANKVENVKRDMTEGSDTLTAFFNNSFLRDDTFEVLEALNSKGTLGASVLDSMIKSNKEDAEIKKKSRSVLVQPLMTIVVGFSVGNYLTSTGVGICRDNPEFGIKVSSIHGMIADHQILFTLGEIAILIPLIIFIINFIILKTGGIYKYLYKANIMIYFLRKAKTPFTGVFEKLKLIIPKSTKAYNVVENMEEEIKEKKVSDVFKEYLNLYPFHIFTTKMPQLSRGDDTDVFLELSEDSLALFNDFNDKISKSLPVMFLFLTIAYVGFGITPLLDFVGAAMQQGG